jgi:hypothetical protein
MNHSKGTALITAFRSMTEENHGRENVAANGD